MRVPYPRSGVKPFHRGRRRKVDTFGRMHGRARRAAFRPPTFSLPPLAPQRRSASVRRRPSGNAARIKRMLDPSETSCRQDRALENRAKRETPETLRKRRPVSQYACRRESRRWRYWRRQRDRRTRDVLSQGSRHRLRARAAFLIGRSPAAAPAGACDREILTMIHLEFQTKRYIECTFYFLPQ